MSDVIAADRRAGRRPARRQGGIGAWLTTTDHKRIGVLYIGTSLVFFLVAVVFAMLMRTQLIRPGMQLLTPEQYNQIFSMHGTTMVFLFAMPMLIGLANYLVPLQIGARDMAFPRMNTLSYWLFLFGGLLLYSSFFFGGALDTGWFSYAPLTLKAYSPHDGVTFWTSSLVLLGGVVDHGRGQLHRHLPALPRQGHGPVADADLLGRDLHQLVPHPLRLPQPDAGVAMLYLDRQYGTVFFNPAGGGDPIIWQHLFWFFGHPEVYILILPAFGIMSEVVPVFSRKPLFGRSSMIVMLGVIGFLGFLVWAHHMFATGLPTFFNVDHGRHQHADRHPHRREDLQLAGDDVGRLAALQDAAPLRLRPHRAVHHRRHHRRHAGRRCRSTGRSRTPTSSSATCTTCSSPAPCSRSSPASTTGSPRSPAASSTTASASSSSGSRSSASASRSCRCTRSG